MQLQPVPFDPTRARLVYRQNLPHWRQHGVAYFVTFRLADSVPAEVVQRWVSEHRRWQELNPPPLSPEKQYEQTAMYGRKLMRYLDRGYGACLLGDATARTQIRDAMLYFDGKRYLLGDYAIMPNHVHVLVMPLGDAELTKIVASWTSYSAARINRCVSRSGRLWQPEPFDHIARHRTAYKRLGQYVRDNPTAVAAERAEAGCGKLRWD